MKPSQLDKSEFAPYFNGFINLIEEVEIPKALKSSKKKLLKILKTLPKEKQEYQYAEGKWTIKELLLHLIDTERILLTRALRFARKDETKLEGFEENDYVDNSYANDRKFADLLKEYKAQRNSSIQFFKGLNHEMLVRKGVASGNVVSVRALGYIISGHDLHHQSVLKSKYL